MVTVMVSWTDSLYLCIGTYDSTGRLHDLESVCVFGKVSFVQGFWSLPVLHAANLTKCNCWFDEGPRGLKLNRDYMSKMSKCNTALPAHMNVSFSVDFAHLLICRPGSLSHHRQQNVKARSAGGRRGLQKIGRIDELFSFYKMY